MIKHVICFKLKNRADQAEAKTLLASMKGNVPMLLDIEVGADFLASARSYDVYLCITLKDKTALDEYQKDPYHCNVVKTYMRERSESSVAVDFEI